MKIISLSALILALKMKEAETAAAAFQLQIMTANSCTYTREIRSSVPCEMTNQKSLYSDQFRKKGKVG